MVAPAALLTTAENFTESCLLRGTLTDLIGRMTVCCYLTLFGLSGAPPMLDSEGPADHAAGLGRSCQLRREGCSIGP